MSGPTITGLYRSLHSLTTPLAFEPSDPTHTGLSYVQRAARGVPPLVDVYLPEGPGPHPSIVLVHGGGWVLGTRRMKPMRYLATELVKVGCAVAVGDYRLVFRGGRIGEAVDDVADKIGWWFDQAEAYGLDPSRVHLAGLSAGATLMLLAAQKHRERTFRRLVSVFGVYDFEGMSGGIGGLIKPLLLEGRDPRTVSPLHLEPLPWPVTLMHGTDDELVAHDQAVAYRDLAREGGHAVDLISYEGQPHAFFNDARSEICQQATRDLLAVLDLAGS
jgi:acetyl esterase/lipase